LRSLGPDPDRQAAYAASLLVPETPRNALQAALEILARSPVPEARSTLVALYRHFAANGPKRDPGSYLRSGIVHALRKVALAEDAALLAQAAQAVERLPPAFKDEAAPLRGAGLVALAGVDDGLAVCLAARLLVDPDADPQSGEPSVTAARVLASLDAPAPLYLVATMEGGAPPEAVSECLRQMTALPVALVPGLIDRFGKAHDPAILVGLCDLLVGHREGPLGLDTLRRLLRDVDDTDVVRYVGLALMGRRSATLQEIVLEAARWETRPARRIALAEALEPFEADPAVAEMLGRLRSAPGKPRG